MKIILDQHGVSVSDVNSKSFAKEAIENETDLHTSNMLVINWARAILLKMDVKPKIDWEFYGQPVSFDNSMRSTNAWNDRRTDADIDPLTIIMEG
jgi:hypothetical protein